MWPPSEIGLECKAEALVRRPYFPAATPGVPLIPAISTGVRSVYAGRDFLYGLVKLYADRER